MALLTAFAVLPRAEAQLIAVTSPDYRSDVHGNTSIHVSAAGYRSPLEVKSWLPGGQYGSDSTVASISLDGNGTGTFDFAADQYPHGPITVRISGTRISDGYADTCYLQLYNTGGISWNEGIPKAAPPAAAGMSLVFDDDFDGCRFPVAVCQVFIHWMLQGRVRPIREAGIPAISILRPPSRPPPRPIR